MRCMSPLESLPIFRDIVPAKRFFAPLIAGLLSNIQRGTSDQRLCIGAANVCRILKMGVKLSGLISASLWLAPSHQGGGEEYNY